MNHTLTVKTWDAHWKDNQARVRDYMLREYTDHIDPQTGELNFTALAEDAAQHFELYLDDPEATIPEDVFDMAVSVDFQLVKEGKVSE